MSRVEDRKRGNRCIIFWPALPWLLLECFMALSQSAPKPDSSERSQIVTGYCALVRSIQMRHGLECRIEIHFILLYRMSKPAVAYSNTTQMRVKREHVCVFCQTKVWTHRLILYDYFSYFRMIVVIKTY